MERIRTITKSPHNKHHLLVIRFTDRSEYELTVRECDAHGKPLKSMPDIVRSGGLDQMLKIMAIACEKAVWGIPTSVWSLPTPVVTE